MKTSTALFGAKNFFVLFFILFSTISFSQSNGISFTKSYINITKGTTGGTVESGDTLEIRVAIHVKEDYYDSCAFFDRIPAGTEYISGSIRIRTNEGLVYKSFTDAISDDQGWYKSPDSIRINLGYDPNKDKGSFTFATATRRGRLSKSHKPTIWNNACLMLATYRIRVTQLTGVVSSPNFINTGGGRVTYKWNNGNGTIEEYIFPGNTVAVYPNVGICSNAVGANTVTDGSFGSGIPQNRSTALAATSSYNKVNIAPSAPGDNNYSIVNNSSSGSPFSTNNNLPIPDATNARVFQFWDIIGDHTGAPNPITGNVPANGTSSAGYMILVNSAYKLDSVFHHTIPDLCPNTYYEISAWVRNICSFCGADSLARQPRTTGYVPTALGDSSGVRPNISFKINGIDYYNSGDIGYTGTWVRKAFTYLTGPTQTSITLTIMNNAPGGGGNDWALDDISVATCSPSMTFTPTSTPSTCNNNQVTFGGRLSSFFNNYTHYKWQKSTNNGSTWADISPAATGTPTLNGSSYEYNVNNLTITATTADNGALFRVVSATTSSNLSGTCALSGNSVLQLSVGDCSVLNTSFLSITGKLQSGYSQLKWNTSKEQDPVSFVVERSTDGIRFEQADTVKGSYPAKNEINFYSWSEPVAAGQKMYYRIKMTNQKDQILYSKIIFLGESAERESKLLQIINPFTDQITAEVYSNDGGIGHIELIGDNGTTIKKQSQLFIQGNNKILLPNTSNISKGIYTLRIQLKDIVITRRVLKQ